MARSVELVPSTASKEMEMLMSPSHYVTHGIVAAPHARPHQTNSLIAVAATMIFALKREIAIRRAGAALEGLSDRLLKDIGISRSDIQRVVREGRVAPRRP
jgi:uncharacterized protein YjiS (DUF1127 family)